MKLGCLACTLLLAFTACGGDDEQLPIDAPIVVDPFDARVIDAVVPIDAPVDAPAPIDAASSVMLVDCNGVTPAETVRAGTGAFVPANPTIDVGDVIRFEPGSPNHDMAATNGEFGTPLGQNACLQFNAAGTFPVRCTIHGFTTTITVSAP